MHGTTRELNFGTITFVSVVFVLLLITIVAGSTAWFRYEFNKQQATRAEKYSNYQPLITANEAQAGHLNGDNTGVGIDQAMRQVAERY